VTTKAIFVGINKHLDATIPELSGARRDATALWALFPDQPEFLQGLDGILQRVEFGLPSAVLPLTKLPVPLIRGQYLALFAAGCLPRDDASKLERHRLNECVGSSHASLMGAQA